jgi:hypothetical protein
MIIKGIELQTLSCQNCTFLLRGEPESIFIFCSNCGSGFEVDSSGSYSAVPVYFAKFSENGQFKPFWAFDATLELKERSTKKSWKTLFSSSRGLASLFEERKSIRFYVPSSLRALENDERAALKLTLEQPELTPCQALTQIHEVTISRKDAEKLADYLFLTSEINLPDVVQDLDYHLDLKNPFLILIQL